MLVAKIRKAKLSDAKELSELAERIFRTAFSDQNSKENMRLHCESSYGEKIQSDEIANPNLLTLVAEVNGKLAAYVQLRWKHHLACLTGHRPGEILRFYVEQAWHGKGLAHKLMEACLKEFYKRNNDSAWLGVWENNPRGISFYKKFNFKEVGEQKFPVGKDIQRDVIMERPMALSCIRTNNKGEIE